MDVADVAKGAVAAAVVLGVLDGLWLGVVAKDWLVQQMGELRRPDIQWVPALAFYVLYSVGISFFAVAPHLETGDWVQAAIVGAVLGLVAYGTYDLTNMATVKNWPTAFSIVDMAWGTILTAASAAGAVLILKTLNWA